MDRNDANIVIMNESPPPDYSEYGYLVVKVYTARGAIPVNGALVTVAYDDPRLESPYAVLMTDRSGSTPVLRVPAPPRSLSLRPSTNGSVYPDENLPYGLYNVEIYKEGFYTVDDIGLKVFSGVTAVQNADLIPRSETLPPSVLKDDSIYINEGGDAIE